MDAREALKELELAAFDQAEAERHERQAKKLRLESVRRIARVHIYFKEAIEQAEHSQTQES